MSEFERRFMREPKRREALPRFNPYSIPPRPRSEECPICPSWIMPEGMRDHIKAKHPDDYALMYPEN